MRSSSELPPRSAPIIDWLDALSDFLRNLLVTSWRTGVDVPSRTFGSIGVLVSQKSAAQEGWDVEIPYWNWHFGNVLPVSGSRAVEHRSGERPAASDWRRPIGIVRSIASLPFRGLHGRGLRPRAPVEMLSYNGD
jgi:hypothetical protein